MTTALVPLADGCEEMEVVIIVDVLRRAGWQVVTAGIEGTTITASRGVVLVADRTWSGTDPRGVDVLILPGGSGGTDTLCRQPSLLDMIRAFVASGKTVAAICAAPLVLQAAGVLKGRRATCHPGVREQFRGTAVEEAVVEDGPIITSQGPGTAFAFALALIRRFDGEEVAERVAGGLILR